MKPTTKRNAFSASDLAVTAVVIRTKKKKQKKHLHKNAGAQEMPHLLQDLLLKYIPCDCPLQIQNKRIPKPARGTKVK